MQQGEYDIESLRVVFSDVVPSKVTRSKGFALTADHAIKQDFASAFSSTSCPIPSYRQPLTCIFQEPKGRGVCSRCFFKLEVVKGHS